MIQLKNINKNNLLTDFNLNINQNGLYFIEGHNINECFTLLNILAGLDFKYSGEYLINDKQVTKKNLNDFRSKYISNIFNRKNLINELSIKDNLKLSKYLNYNNSSIQLFSNVNYINVKNVEDLNFYESIVISIYKALVINKSKIIILDDFQNKLTDSDRLNLYHIIKENKNNAVFIIADEGLNALKEEDDKVIKTYESFNDNLEFTKIEKNLNIKNNISTTLHKTNIMFKNNNPVLFSILLSILLVVSICFSLTLPYNYAKKYDPLIDEIHNNEYQFIRFNDVGKGTQSYLKNQGYDIIPIYNEGLVFNSLTDIENNKINFYNIDRLEFNKDIIYLSDKYIQSKLKVIIKDNVRIDLEDKNLQYEDFIGAICKIDSNQFTIGGVYHSKQLNNFNDDFYDSFIISTETAKNLLGSRNNSIWISTASIKDYDKFNEDLSSVNLIVLSPLNEDQFSFINDYNDNYNRNRIFHMVFLVLLCIMLLILTIYNCIYKCKNTKIYLNNNISRYSIIESNILYDFIISIILLVVSIIAMFMSKLLCPFIKFNIWTVLLPIIIHCGLFILNFILDIIMGCSIRKDIYKIRKYNSIKEFLKLGNVSTTLNENDNIIDIKNSSVIKTHIHINKPLWVSFIIIFILLGIIAPIGFYLNSQSLVEYRYDIIENNDIDYFRVTYNTEKYLNKIDRLKIKYIKADNQFLYIDSVNDLENAGLMLYNQDNVLELDDNIVYLSDIYCNKTDKTVLDNLGNTSFLSELEYKDVIGRIIKFNNINYTIGGIYKSNYNPEHSKSDIDLNFDEEFRLDTYLYDMFDKPVIKNKHIDDSIWILTSSVNNKYRFINTLKNNLRGLSIDVNYISFKDVNSNSNVVSSIGNAFTIISILGVLGLSITIIISIMKNSKLIINCVDDSFPSKNKTAIIPILFVIGLFVGSFLIGTIISLVTNVIVNGMLMDKFGTIFNIMFFHIPVIYILIIYFVFILPIIIGYFAIGKSNSKDKIF